MFEKFENGFISDFGSSCDQLKDFIYRKSEALFEKGEAMRAQITTIEQLESHKKEMRQRFIESIGGLVETNLPLDAKVTKVEEYDEFTLESIIYRSCENTYVTGSMYLPKGIAKPAPAVLFVCGHSQNGRMYDVYQVVCRTLVRAGLIVFAIDPTGQGERANYYDRETREYKLTRAVYDHDGYGVPAVATGRFLQRYLLCDEMRAVDYMLTRPEIDPARIGVTGNSGGGTQTMAMMMCDDRIAAAAPGTFVTNRREYLYTGQPQDSEQIWPGMTEYGMDHVTPIMIFAPRPVTILALEYDFFCIEGTRETYEEAKRFYGLYGKEGLLRLKEDKYTHQYTPKLAVEAAAFFSEIFYGEKKMVRNDDIVLLSEEQMYATQSGQVIGEIPDAKPMQQIVKEYGEALGRKRSEADKKERLAAARQWLNDKVMHDRTPMEFNVRMLPEELCAVEEGYLGIPMRWWSQRRLFTFGMMIKAQKYQDITDLPTVIGLWTDGTEQISAHEDWIRNQCDAGKQVFVIDLPGSGQIRQNSMQKHATEKGYLDTLYTLCGDLMYIGDSMAAMRCYDVLRTVEMLQVRFGIAPENVTIYCEGKEGVYGVMAGFLNENVKMEYGSGLLLQVEKEILGQDVFCYDNTLPLLVPGMLAWFDYEELLR